MGMQASSGAAWNLLDRHGLRFKKEKVSGVREISEATGARTVDRVIRAIGSETSSTPSRQMSAVTISETPDMRLSGTITIKPVAAVVSKSRQGCGVPKPRIKLFINDTLELLQFNVGKMVSKSEDFPAANLEAVRILGIGSP